MTILFRIFKRFGFSTFSRKKVEKEIRKNWKEQCSPFVSRKSKRIKR
jgi:hypothetical protein